MRKTKVRAFVAVLLVMALAFPVASLAAEAPSEVLALNTDGVPVSCGTAAVRLRAQLQTAQNVDVYPRLYSGSNEEVADTTAATGMTVRFEQDGETREYEFALVGDLTGSGTFTLSQLVAFAAHMRTQDWTPLLRAAGDINGDSGTPGITDLVLLVSYYKAQNPQAPSDPYPSEETPDEPDTPFAGKTLVTWFSASGNTQRVAETIVNELGADEFVIEPAQPYTSADLNYSDPDSRVCQEHDDESLRNIELVQAEVPDFDQYDTVFIGYPIWWGIAAWPVNTFVQANDFDGKTVYCFCTASSSPIGNSATLLEGMANGGTWEGGTRFRSSEVGNADVITQWLDSLHLAA